MALSYACEAFIEYDEIDCDCDFDGDVDEIVEEASDLLVQLSGGEFFGRCTTTVRPVALCDCLSVCAHTCSADGTDWIPLPGYEPEVSEVKIDGVVVSSGDYALLDGRYLIRTSATDSRPPSWPRRNPLWKPDTAEGTFSITYAYGRPVGQTVKNATAELACDLIKGSKGKSAFNQFSTSANLDGLTITREVDPEQMEEAGFTWVARFLRIYGPSSKTAVWSPELAYGWQLHTVT